MRARLLGLASLLMLTAPLLAIGAAADDFNADRSPYHHERTILSVEVDSYTFNLPSETKAEWAVTVSSGLDLDVYFMDQSQVDLATTGELFSYYKAGSKKNTRSMSGSYSRAGDFGIAVTTSGISDGECTYTIAITKKPIPRAGAAGNTLLGVAIALIIVLVIAGWAYRAYRAARSVHGLVGKEPEPVPSTILDARPAPPPPAAVPQMICPSCGLPAVYDLGYRRYFCTGERRWL